MTEQRSLHLLGATGASRTEQYDGREHLVVPVVCLIGDNVIHAVNAPMPEWVGASVLNAQGWDGRPLVIGHPVKDGHQISANDPRIMEQQAFGFMAATHVKNKKLGTEAWMDVAKLEKLGQHKMLADARAGLPIEVSVGAYVQTREKPGMVNGKKYQHEWATMAPDHLAFLPGGTGACSVEMGCGANRAAMRVCGDALELETLPTLKKGSQMNKKRKALLAPFLKALDAEANDQDKAILEAEGLGAEEDDDPDEAAETISYEAMRALIEQAKVSLDEGSKHVDALIADNGAGDNEAVEDAHLEALVAMCVQLYGTTNGVIKMATACLAPEGSTSPMAYMESRAAAGARHNSSDQKIVQDTHDSMVKLGADCSAMKAAASGDCGCEGGDMTNGQWIAETAKHGISEEQVKGLEMLPSTTIDALRTLAGKNPADAIIQAKANADAALAGHAHGLNAMDAADKAKADKKDADAAAKAKEDAKDGGKDDNEEDASGKKVKAAMKAAAAAGISVEEYEEQEFLKTAPASIRAMAAKHKAAEATRKSELVKALDGGPLTAKQLDAKPIEELETLAAYAKAETVDYSGRGVARSAEEKRDDTPPNPYSKENIDKRFKTVN